MLLSRQQQLLRVLSGPAAAWQQQLRLLLVAAVLTSQHLQQATALSRACGTLLRLVVVLLVLWWVEIQLRLLAVTTQLQHLLRRHPGQLLASRLTVLAALQLQQPPRHISCSLPPAMVAAASAVRAGPSP